jgi:regulator of sigma E protease
MLAILFIILLFASLVIFHEWGHFIVAKRSGVEVEEFGIGFPPKLFGRKWRGTEYTFNLLPLGGFVRLKGEDAADKSPGSFNAASYLAKAKILLAGVGMNLVAAVVILYGLCLTGLPGLGGAFEPGFLKATYAQPKQLLLAKVESGSPADKAGLKRGDFVLSGNGKVLATDVDLHQFTQDHAGQKVKLQVKQSGQEKTIEVKLREPGAKDGFLGVSAQQVYKLRYDPLSALGAAIYITGALFVATIVGVLQLLINIPTLLLNVFSHDVPAAAQAASGPVGIIYIMQSMSSLGMSYILLFMANISVALAAFNVLPLPALDGGRLAVATVQRFTKRQWSADAEARYHAIGFMALIGLILLISVYDLRKFF